MPKDAAAARQALYAIIDRATAQIAAKAEVHRMRAEINDSLAADRLAFDDSPEAERLRRFDLACGRGLARSLDSLIKLRRAPELNECPSSVISEPTSEGEAVESSATANATIEPTVACENVTNEPNADAENETNEPTDACEIVAIELTDAFESVTNEASVTCENTTNEATAAHESPTDEPTMEAQNLTIEPTLATLAESSQIEEIDPAQGQERRFAMGGRGWADENSRFLRVLGLARFAESVALLPSWEGVPCFGWSRTRWHAQAKTTSRPPSIAAPGGCLYEFSRTAEISGRRSTRRCRSESRSFAPRCAICVGRRTDGVPKRRHCNSRPKSCVPNCNGKPSSPPRAEAAVARCPDPAFKLIPPRHQFGSVQILLMVRWFLSGMSLRGSCTAVDCMHQIDVEWGFGFPVPHYTTVRFWLLRVGLHKLNRPKEQASDWVWIIDHSNQIGKEKCLVILGYVSRNCHSRARTIHCASSRWSRSSWSR